MGIQKTSQSKAGFKAKTAIEGESIEIVSAPMEERSHVERVLRRHYKERQHGRRQEGAVSRGFEIAAVAQDYATQQQQAGQSESSQDLHQ
jgi:hypothetical protein